MESEDERTKRLQEKFDQKMKNRVRVKNKNINTVLFTPKKKKNEKN